MKAIALSVTALMLLGTLTVGMAEDAVTDVTVDEQITSIQEAPAQERVRLMNQFKLRLATMNETDREAAITQLRTQTQTRTQTQERSRINEMQQTQQMQQQQQMNQQQLRNQVGQIKSNMPAPSGMAK